MGYKVGILVETPLRVRAKFVGADEVISQQAWQGFSKAVNRLCRSVPGNIVVVAGDDVYPHREKAAEEIGIEFLRRFPNTFGVMQPTGDKFGGYLTACISPWIGRAFIEQVYGGNGPYWEEYFHYFNDTELQEVATRLDAFQQRPDLTQYHDHWQRRGEQRPPHLLEAERRWRDMRDLFDRRKRAGFPNRHV